MNIYDFEGDGYKEIPNPNYNPKSKYNTEPKTLRVEDTDPQRSAVLEMADYDLAHGYHIDKEVNDKWAEQGWNYNQWENLDKHKLASQSNWEKAFNSLSRLVVDELLLGSIKSISDIGGAIFAKVFNAIEDDYHNPFSDWLAELQNKFKEITPIERDTSLNIDNGGLSDFGWWADNMPQVGSTVALLVGAKAWTSAGSKLLQGATKLGKAAGLPKAAKWIRGVQATKAAKDYSKFRLALNSPETIARAKALGETATEAVLMRTAENYQESGETHTRMYTTAMEELAKLDNNEFQELLNTSDFKDKNIKTRDELARYVAKQAADRTYAMDFSNLIFDILQLHALKNIGLAKPMNRAGGRAVGVAQENSIRSVASEVLGKAETPATGFFNTNPIGKGLVKTKDFLKFNTKVALAESNEGIEEAINYIAQEEGISYGKALLAGKNDNYRYDEILGLPTLSSITNSWSKLQTPLNDYLKNPTLHDSAFWGVMGGWVFGAAGKLHNNYQTNKAIEDSTRNLNNATGKENKSKFGQFLSRFQDVDSKQAVNSINHRNERLTELINSVNRIREGYDVYAEPVDGKTPKFEDTTVIPELGMSMAQHQSIEAAKQTFLNDIALDAIDNGTFNLLIDYMSSDAVKQALVEKGIINQDTADEDTNKIVNSLNNIADLYTRHTTQLLNQAAYLNASKQLDDDIELQYLQILSRQNIENLLQNDALDRAIKNLQVSVDNTNKTRLEQSANRNKTELEIEEEKANIREGVYASLLSKKIAELQNYKKIKETAENSNTPVNPEVSMKIRQLEKEINNIYSNIKQNNLAVEPIMMYAVRAANTKNNFVKTDKEILSENPDYFTDTLSKKNEENYEDIIADLTNRTNVLVNRNNNYSNNMDKSLFDRLKHIYGMESSKLANLSNIISTTDDLALAIDAMHNNFNDARQGAITLAGEIFAKALYDYKNADGTLNKNIFDTIVHLYNKDKKKAFDLIDSTFEQKRENGSTKVTAQEFKDALDIFNFTNASNDAIYNYFKSTYKGIEAMLKTAEEKQNAPKPPIVLDETQSIDDVFKNLNFKINTVVNNEGTPLETEIDFDNDNIWSENLTTKPSEDDKKNRILSLLNNDKTKDLFNIAPGTVLTDEWNVSGKLKYKTNPDGSITIIEKPTLQNKKAEEANAANAQNQIQQTNQEPTQQQTGTNATQTTTEPAATSPVVKASEPIADSMLGNDSNSVQPLVPTNNVVPTPTQESENPSIFSTGEEQQILEIGTSDSEYTPEQLAETEAKLTDTYMTAINEKGFDKNSESWVDDVESVKIEVLSAHMDDPGAWDLIDKVAEKIKVSNMLTAAAELNEVVVENAISAEDELTAIMNGTVKGGITYGTMSAFANLQQSGKFSAFEQAFDEFLRYYEQYMIHHTVDDKTTIRLQDILYVCAKVVGNNNVELAKTLYDVVYNTLNTDKYKDKYIIIDNKEKESVINAAMSNNEVDNNLVQSGDRVMLNDAYDFDSLKVNDTLHASTRVDTNNRTYIELNDSQGKRVGTMAVPTLVNDAYSMLNEGWMYRLKVSNGQVVSPLKDMFKLWLTCDDKTHPEYQNIKALQDCLIEYISKCESLDNDIRDSKYNYIVDKFAKNPIIANLVEYNRKLRPEEQIMSDKAEMPDLFVHLAKLYAHTYTVLNGIDKTYMNMFINNSIDTFFDKLYTSYDNLYHAGDGDVVITGVSDGALIKVTKDADGNTNKETLEKVKKDPDNNLPTFAEAKADTDSVEYRIGITGMNTGDPTTIAGKPNETITEFGTNSTLLAVYTPNVNSKLAATKSIVPVTAAFGLSIKSGLKGGKSTSLNTIAKAAIRTLTHTVNDIMETSDELMLDQYANEFMDLLDKIITNNNKGHKNKCALLRGGFVANLTHSQNGPVININCGNSSFIIFFKDHFGKKRMSFQIKNGKTNQIETHIQAKKTETTQKGDFKHGSIHEMLSVFENKFVTYLMDNGARVNISRTGIMSDASKQFKEQAVKGFFNYENGKLVLNIKRDGKDYEADYKREYNSYNDYILGENLIVVDMGKDKTTKRNFTKKSKKQTENQNLYVSLPKGKRREVKLSHPTQITSIPVGTSEENSRKRLNDVHDIVRTDTTGQDVGKTLFNYMFGEDAFKGFIPKNASASTMNILDLLLPKTMVYVGGMNYLENGDYGGAFAWSRNSSNPNKANTSYRIYPSGKNSKQYRRFPKGVDIVVGDLFVTLAASTDINHRYEALRVMIHENLHTILQENPNRYISIMSKIADIYEDVKENVAFDLMQNPNDKILQHLEQILNQSGLHKDIAVEEFLVESLTNNALFAYMNNLTIKEDDARYAESNDTGKDTIFTKLIKWIAKLFNKIAKFTAYKDYHDWTIKNHSMFMYQLNKLRELTKDNPDAVTNKKNSKKTKKTTTEIVMPAPLQHNEPITDVNDSTDEVNDDVFNVDNTGDEVPSNVEPSEELNNINILGDDYVDDFDFDEGNASYFGNAPVSAFNTDKLDSNLVDYEIKEEPWKNDKTKLNTKLNIYLKGEHNKGYFQLVKDQENNYYSVHFKTATGDSEFDTPNTDASTKEERKTLFKELIKAIPDFAYVSTWGEITNDGVKGLNNVGRYMLQIGERTIKDKKTKNNVTVPIYQKVPDTFVYRTASTQEVDDIKKEGRFREMPENMIVEGADQYRYGRFNLGKERGQSHGGKGFKAKAPYKGTSFGSSLQDTYVIGVPGTGTKWKKGFHGKYTKDFFNFEDLEIGETIWEKFDEDGYISLPTDGMILWKLNKETGFYEQQNAVPNTSQNTVLPTNTITPNGTFINSDFDSFANSLNPVAKAEFTRLAEEGAVEMHCQ